MSGQRDRFVAETLHKAAVARDHIRIVIDETAPEARVQEALGQRHAHCSGDALPEGPVVASTPGVWPYSGCPGVFDPHCLNDLSSSDVKPS